MRLVQAYFIRARQFVMTSRRMSCSPVRFDDQKAIAVRGDVVGVGEVAEEDGGEQLLRRFGPEIVSGRIDADGGQDVVAGDE